METGEALLGQKKANPNDDPEKSKDEEDLQERSTKKKKDGDQIFSNQSSLPKDYSDVMMMQTNENNGVSYKDKVTGEKKIGGYDSGREKEDEEEEEEAEGESMMVEEGRVGNYECPKFIFSKQEEKRIFRPWRRGVIVKLLGRRIGYKALETRLKQMWVRKGVINIIDLSNDYFLVAFSNEEDQYAALMDGPWFIYDHYLTVKEWSPNFHPASDTIKEVAVWMRISGLPIEYYDSRILHFIGNRVGKTVKVDKNTLTQERGKYARLCVQVNLTKPLLAMFTIKDRKYNIEYEGLHLLCTTCGRFGHYKEGCPDKGREPAAMPDGNGSVGGGDGRQNNMMGSGVEGPWRVVQKQKRPRKVAPMRNTVPELNKDDLSIINAANLPQGSRFASLMEDIPDTNEANPEREETSQETNMATNDGGRENRMEFEKRSQRVKNRRGISAGGVIIGDVAENNKKDSKLATRGGSNFKGKPGVLVKKGGPIRENSVNAGQVISNSENTISTNDVGNGGTNIILHPNRPRPPNWNGSPVLTPTTSKDSNVNMLVREGEVFLDADEQGSNASFEADMDIVVETPNSQ
ncbi:hypothetical protein P8452_53697 [Trifolium repens]|nr:hypothetical protein P8452_53697 [Trifolium repens]